MMMPRVLKRSRPCCNKVDTKLVNLPRDVLIDIILRLPLKSICSVQCASKTLNNLVDKIFVAQWYTRRLHNALPSGHQVPQLMLLARSHDKSDTVTKTFSLQYQGGHDSNMREHRNGSEIIVSHKCAYQVQCVFQNLICFKDVNYGGPSFLLDPQRGDILRLPASEVPIPASVRCRRELFDWLVMGFDETNGTFKILRVCGNSHYKNLVAQVLVLGTSSWRQIPAVPPCNLSHKNAYACGDVHWVIDKKSRREGKGESNIVSFDFKKEEFYWSPHPTLRNDGSCISDLNLVNLRGCLAIVDTFLGYKAFIDIWVLRNYDEKKWVRQYCIGKTMFSMDVTEIMTNCGEWEHGIYFKDAISTGAQNRAICMFLDLRGGTDGDEVKLVKCPIASMQNWTIISYTRSLISLKYFGDLVEAEHVMIPTRSSLVSRKKLGNHGCMDL